MASCSTAAAAPGHDARADYQLGRSLAVKGDWVAARRALELSLSRGYAAAGIDLADLLMTPAAGAIDKERALSLYKQAWRDGIPIAAFRLGQFYEKDASLDASLPKAAPGVTVAEASPPQSSAWFWYAQGVAAGEPNALARYAERDEQAALGSQAPLQRNDLLLKAFAGYAAASLRAARENWPDDAWRHWRYRRASLARVLAADGLMQPVADAFAAVVNR
jgi:TPR repeat protein